MSNLAADALERELQFPFAKRLPPLGGAIEISPGFKWLRMPMPFELNHINLWLLRDRVEGRLGWAVVDCCVDRPDARQAWENVLANELEGLPILRVLVTHMHPDHVGLAHWLCERWSLDDFDCRMWMSEADYGTARFACEAVGSTFGKNMARFFATHGLSDPHALEQINQRQSYYRSLVPHVPTTHARLLDGMEVRIGDDSWRCIAGYGHSPEHMAFYSSTRGMLIAGDMVLPRISTNVSVYDSEPESDPLALFLKSLERYSELPADTLVLPSHGRPFTGLHKRIEQLQHHHQERLDDIMVVARDKSVSAWDVLPVLFKRDLDLHQTTFALGEAVAHLNNLWVAGQLKRVRDDKGVWRFRAT